MDDDVGQGGGRGAARRPRDRRGGGRGRPRGHDLQQQRGGGGRLAGRGEGQMEVGEVESEAVAPPREPPRRRVRIGLTALDRLLQSQPEQLLLQITNRVSVKQI